MLILTRRIGERLLIGDDISVSILGVKGNQVRVGIDAPKAVLVYREELYERLKLEIGGANDARTSAQTNDPIDS